MTEQTPQPVSRAQRTLAFIGAGLVILSIVCFLVLMIGTWLGAGPDQGSGKGIWPTVELLPLVALPLAFLCIVAVLIMSVVARSRQNRKSGR
ncbi:hypothetical protein ACX9R5_07925 [Rathayibacter sp. CAU 1779]